MAVQIQVRRDTAANWTTNNPTLAAGEWAYETDTGKFKMGDGSTAWTSLAYVMGEVNTASNVGTAGVGVFKQKTGVDLEFKKINAGSTKVSITDDVANSEVDIDVNEGNINHDNLSGFVANEHIDWTIDQGATNIHAGNYTDTDTTDHTLLSNIGTNTHAQIDTHIASTSNPHSVDISDVSPLTTKGDLMSYSTVNTRLGVGADGQVLVADSAEATGLKWADTAGGASYPKGHIYGLETYYFSDTQIKIKVGNCRDVDDSYDMTNASELTVAITSSGANGLDTGSEASSTWYHIWLIEKSSDGTEAGLLSTSSTAPTMPTGYDKKRRVGTVFNNSSSNFRKFSSYGKNADKEVSYFGWETVLSSGTSSSWTNIDCTDELPSTNYVGIMHFEIYRQGGMGSDYIYLRSNNFKAEEQLWQYERDGYAKAGWGHLYTDGDTTIQYKTTGNAYVSITGYKESL